jgi:integrative and conjugative element protein (TIGR02256 family)
MELTYCHKSCSQRLVLSAEVVAHLQMNRQTTGPEVGGQLFGIINDEGTITVVLATGPRTEDRKSRFLFFPSRYHEKREIKAQFKKGLHYLGDWHTHPESEPSPSGLDLESMKECFAKSRHEHASFIMIIVGNTDAPKWLWVSLHNVKTYIRLERAG